MDDADRDRRREQLERLIQAAEEEAQRLNCREYRRQRTGVYDRYMRLIRHRAAAVDREELEWEVARLTAALKHRLQLQDIRAAREDVAEFRAFFWRQGAVKDRLSANAVLRGGRTAVGN